jgi:hypothetical protein
MDPQTDVSTAQSFDVTSFLNNVVNAGVSIAGQRVSPTQSNGQPSVAQAPNLRATGPAGSAGPAPAAGGSMTNQTLLLGAAVVAVIVVVYLARK